MERNKQQGNFWLYEGKIEAIISILGAMYCFEYYIVSKKLEWLLCENHHNILIGTGQPMIDKIQFLRENLETVNKSSRGNSSSSLGRAIAKPNKT